MLEMQTLIVLPTPLEMLVQDRPDRIWNNVERSLRN